MGPVGLPALMKEAKRFKVKGKGHEVGLCPATLCRYCWLMLQSADLKALLETYQIWAHRMFPRGDFMDTMTRVENVLRTRRMEASVSLSPISCFCPSPAK